MSITVHALKRTTSMFALSVRGFTDVSSAGQKVGILSPIFLSTDVTALLANSENPSNEVECLHDLLVSCYLKLRHQPSLKGVTRFNVSAKVDKLHPLGLHPLQVRWQPVEGSQQYFVEIPQAA